MCFIVFIKFIVIGKGEFLIFLNNSFGLLVCSIWLEIFVIFKLGFILVVMWCNCFCVFNNWMNFCKFLVMVDV